MLPSMLPSSCSTLVACNIYISAGRATHAEKLLKIISSTQERCRNLRIGNIDPVSTIFFRKHDKSYNQNCTAGPTIERSDGHHHDADTTFISKPKIALVHAFADSPYDRSSFHLVGHAHLVADVASSLASSAIHQFSTSTNHHHTTNDAASAENDGVQNENTSHPTVGLVDHVSILPLVRQHQSTYTSHATTIAARYVGESLSNIGIQVYYYGSAHPENMPLATVRRQYTSFFQSEQLSSSSSSKNKLTTTVGSPPKFVENYNVRLTHHVRKKYALKLTKRLRQLGSIEALTLPYSKARYEIACNLLNPTCSNIDESSSSPHSSVHDIMNEVDLYVNELITLQQSSELRHRIDDVIVEPPFLDLPSSGKVVTREYIVDKCYRVGTTESQCLDLVEKMDDPSFNLESYDQDTSSLFKNFIMGHNECG